MSLDKILKPGQIEAIEKMHNGCILCGDVGSGKSRTSLAYYYTQHGGDLYSEKFKFMENPRPLYIITTAHKRDTLEWDGEMIPFLIQEQTQVVVDSWNNIKKYSKVIGAFFIFDEQRVVGRGAWVKAFLKIARRNKWILLSATPGDTWSDYIPVFVANGFYENRSEFNREHVVYKPFRNYPVIDHYVNTGRLIKYRNMLLVDIPESRHTVQHHEDISVSYDISKYKDAVRKRWNPFEDKPIENSSEYCQVLRRITNTSESRQMTLLEIFEDHPRIIVFYNYDYELGILENMYFGKDVVIAQWNGHKHEPVPESERWVYLVQYNAGAEGWNCTTTDTMVFYSQSYSYKTMKQSSGRIDRMNTPFTDLYYYHLKSKSGIDLAIDKCLREKKQFNEAEYAKPVMIRWALPIGIVKVNGGHSS